MFICPYCEKRLQTEVNLVIDCSCDGKILAEREKRQLAENWRRQENVDLAKRKRSNYRKD